MVMGWNVFKLIRIKCNDCKETIDAPKDGKTWKECSCGGCAVKGAGVAKQIRGKNYEDLSIENWEGLEGVDSK